MTPTTPSAPDEVVLDEKGVVCPKCGGSGDFEEPNLDANPPPRLLRALQGSMGE